MGFYLGLFIFIASVVIGLVLMIAGKGMKREKFMLLVSIHGILLFATLAALLLKGSTENNVFFLGFICSGIILGGLSWRNKEPVFFKWYFSIFLLTIPLFLLSPSTLLSFLLTMSFSNPNAASFDLGHRYFLESQSTVRSDTPFYKIVRKRGLYHQTIRREIDFNGKLDSVRVMEYIPGQSMTLRGFTSDSTFVSTDVDSTDMQVSLVKNQPGGKLEYRL